MFVQRKTYLEDIKRIRIPEGRDLESGLRLDRNERVDGWSDNILSKIFGEKPDYFLSVYPDLSGLYERLAKFNSVKEEEILVTSGIDGGIKTLFEIMTEPGDLVGVVSPTYAMYMVYSKLFQTRLENITYNKDLSFNYAEFERFIEKKPTMFFLPNPNQPIESAFTVKELEILAKKLLDANCLFIIDEAYHLFGCDTGVSLINKFENVVIARTFSKGFGVPSIRLGYLISNISNMNIFSKTRFAHESNSVSNAVAEYLLDNYNIVEEYNSEVIQARDYTQKVLLTKGIKANGGKGNYLLLDMENQDRAQKYVDHLKKNLIYVKGPWGAPWEKYITITIGPKRLMEKFLNVTDNFIQREI